MNEKPNPPPSLSKVGESNRLTEALEQTKKQTLQDAEVNFTDDFAPSSSPVKDLSNSGVLGTKASRLACYNDHVIDYMEGALDRACQFGLPRIHWLFPLQYPPVSEALYNAIVPLVGAISEGLVEQSDDWLALKCYLCWLDACHALTNGASPLLVAERMFVAGATAREFELSVKNRRHAALGRKQTKTLTEHRCKANSEKRFSVAVRRANVSRMMAETNRTGGALEKYLKRRLKDEHEINASLRTIRRDLSELRTP